MSSQYSNRRKGKIQEKGSNLGAAPASIIGEPFHNPYTFIPFPDRVERKEPTPITIDEKPEERGRKSGVLELEIKTLAPLMTCSPPKDKEKNGHQTLKALTIGNDVIVPSTGIRGVLRTLMTIISGGTLGYMDEDLCLTQGRDAQLGPNKKISNIPSNAFLAEVIRPGNAISSGEIELGETKLIRAEELKKTIKELDRKRPTTGKKPLSHLDSAGKTWKVKLSGRPIRDKNKKEGLFKGNGKIITLSEHFWSEYQGRHRHAAIKELRKGDLIWLEPVDPDCTTIEKESDIKSIQWARWGRQGVKFKNIMMKTSEVVIPDSMKDDGKVDMVTDLFGQIPKKDIKAAGPFAARIRPGNLIFFDAKDKLKSETLAPLAPPHPGCIAFYSDQENLDEISNNSPLKGYKVYRNTIERGDDAPWKYKVQGVYKERGELKTPEKQTVNKTAELIDENLTGKLRISFRALNDEELALIYAACSVDWKIGGGKPLGLGHCRVVNIKMIDEDSKKSCPMRIPDDGSNLKLKPEDKKCVEHFQDRIELYRASQEPVPKLRYPRAVTRNRNKTTRSGFCWFARHAAPKKSGTKGLETLWTAGELFENAQKSQIKAQALPRLNPDDINADLLYGYDLVDTVMPLRISGQKKRVISGLEKFESIVHAGSNEKAGENISQNRESREQAKQQRTYETKIDLSHISKENIYEMIRAEFRDRRLTPARAEQYLKKLEEFKIEREQNKKWKNTYKVLDSIASRG